MRPRKATYYSEKTWLRLEAVSQHTVKIHACTRQDAQKAQARPEAQGHNMWGPQSR